MITKSASKIVCIGHRGAAGYAPENTLGSIQKALNLGADWIEIDVHALQSEIIVIHDRSLKRTTSGRGHIQRHSLSYIRSLDAGTGEKIPLLSEVFDLVNQKAGLLIELKGLNCAIQVGHFISKKIRAGWSKNKIIVSSFKHNQLQLIHDHFPQIPIGVLYRFPRRGYTKIAIHLNAVSVHLPLRPIRKIWIQEAHNANLKVFVYTVNHPPTMRRLVQWGVNGFFSDYPDRVIAVRNE
ncbi:glycerophosphodiester phosphodiesterase [bacterium]|nr:glycerophosphodiester phosphodiesterase [bacterium]